MLVLTNPKQNHVATVSWMDSQHTAQTLQNIRFAGSTPARAIKPAAYSVSDRRADFPCSVIYYETNTFCKSQVFRVHDEDIQNRARHGEVSHAA